MKGFFVNGLLSGLSYIPVACGLTLSYGVTGVFNFAHGVFYIMAGSLAFVFTTSLGIAFGLSALASVLVTVISAIIVWSLIFSPLLKQKASPTILMIASIAVLILLQNAWLLLMGNNRVVLQYEFLDTPLKTFEPQILSFSQLLVVPVAFLSWLGVEAVLRFTKLGLSMRAVSSNRVLAAEQGFNLKYIYVVTFALGATLACVSSFLDLIDSGVGIDPIRNMRVVLISTFATLVGGVYSVSGTALACVLIGVVRSLSIWLTDANWTDGITAGLMVLFICVRTVGISGRRPWREAA